MARTCVLSVDDSTPDAGQVVTVSATFHNDGAAVSIVSVASLIAAGQAALYEKMVQNLVGVALPDGSGSPTDTVVTFPVVAFSGQAPSFSLTIDLQAFLSDGANIDATGVALTVSPPTFPGGTFPNDG
jgi:hypothetical protein